MRNGTHLSRVGDFLFRLRLVRVVAEDGSEVYEAHAEAHIDQLERRRFLTRTIRRAAAPPGS